MSWITFKRCWVLSYTMWAALLGIAGCSIIPFPEPAVQAWSFPPSWSVRALLWRPGPSLCMWMEQGLPCSESGLSICLLNTCAVIAERAPDWQKRLWKNFSPALRRRSLRRADPQDRVCPASLLHKLSVWTWIRWGLGRTWCEVKGPWQLSTGQIQPLTVIVILCVYLYINNMK